MIDYVLTKTGHKSIYYIGHSQGATSLYATLATKTEYNKKIKLFIALAPAVLMGSSSNFLIDTGAKILKLYGTTVSYYPNSLFWLVTLQNRAKLNPYVWMGIMTIHLIFEK